MRRVQAHKIRATREERVAGPRSLLVVHAAELLTLQGPIGPRRGEGAEDLGLIEDGALYAEDERIVDVGPTSDVLARHPHASVKIDATGQTVLPGFVDAHTHAVFVGTRADEFEWRIQGDSYMEILGRGGGILSSVKALRQESDLKIRFAQRFLELHACFGMVDRGGALPIHARLWDDDHRGEERIRTPDRG